MNSVDKEEKVNQPEETGRNSGTIDSLVPPQGDDEYLVDYVPDLGEDDSSQVYIRGGRVSDLGKQRVTSSYTLDNKPHFQHGMWIDVKVMHIVSPSEFYVIPRKTTECIRRAAFPPATSKSTPPVNPMMHDGSMSNIPDTGTEEFGTGVEAFDKIKAKLNELLEPNMAWRQRQSVHYALTELVAVKRTENGARTWLRGVVLEANLTNVADRGIPYHKVQLIDAGQVLTLRADEMCSLPVYVSYYPALAYKCCLKGVVPVGNIWSRRASVALQSMTTGTNIKINVSKSDKTDVVCKTIEAVPYLVDLLVPRFHVPQDLTIETSAPMVSAAEVLASNALALDFNQFPTRPILNQFFDQKMVFSPINPNVNAEPVQMLAKDFQFLATDKKDENEEKKKDADNYSLYSAEVGSTLPSNKKQ
ncbi:uncharacterized protein LOC110856798 [Folsomia candida]|uniref:RING finger protein 17 n=1 Tax=Folsomia candida TaxID=158441 RepID=A0A226DJL9_FOLCA|nr:uncharacterized protein LOC110856798 [Folsomia candida]OXA45732.1 RING finger protein 17 [Folsomia candida]